MVRVKKHLKKHQKPLLVFGVPAILLLVWGIVHFWGARYVSTDNAYVKADKIPISVEISGHVVQVTVPENAWVQQGDLLFAIDDSAYQLAVKSAQSQLEKTKLSILGLQKSYQIAQKNLKIAEVDLDYWRKEEDRQKNLIQKGYISSSKMDNAHHHTEVAELKIGEIQEDIKRMEILLGGLTAESFEAHPDYQTAQTEWLDAERDLKNTQVKAPRSGVVSHLPKVGEYLSPSRMATVLVADHPIWIEANFNEGDMTHVRTGQTVKIRVDSFPDQAWQGVVESINPATGEEFSILPAQNASGNWVKIVQRIPVRIKIEKCVRHCDDRELRDLKVGMSAWVQIDTEFYPSFRTLWW